MSWNGYTLDVSPTSAKRVKIRWYETRSLEAGGNVLLVQGQISIEQYLLLEQLLLAGASGEGVTVSLRGRYHTTPGLADRMRQSLDASSAGRRRTSQGEATSKPADGARHKTGLQPRAPGLNGPVIGPNGIVDDADDFAELAAIHVQRMLRRRAKAAAV